MADQYKRETAHKIRIGDLLKATPMFEPTESLNKRLNFVELGTKQMRRVNIIANVIDKFKSEGERIFATLTLDDGSGQIRVRLFGEETNKFDNLIQGDTLLVIGLLRSYNEELYILPEIIKKQDPRYLLVRKLEIEKSFPKPATPEQKQEVRALRDDIIEKIKGAEKNQGIDKEQLVMELKTVQPELITQEIQKLIEDGMVYEPKPGRVRYLG